MGIVCDLKNLVAPNLKVNANPLYR